MLGFRARTQHKDREIVVFFSMEKLIVIHKNLMLFKIKAN